MNSLKDKEKGDFLNIPKNNGLMIYSHPSIYSLSDSENQRDVETEIMSNEIKSLKGVNNPKEKLFKLKTIDNLSCNEKPKKQSSVQSFGKKSKLQNLPFHLN